MKKLWAPWRKAYILGKSSKKCFLCDIGRSKKDQEHFVLKRTRYSFSVLNLFPYNNGHVMIVPGRHVSGLEKLKDSELLDVMRLVNQTVQLIGKKMKPNGMNIGINYGRAGGAGVPGHVHIHIVPRWSGDTNFMPVIGDVKVISESLGSVYRRLKASTS